MPTTNFERIPNWSKKGPVIEVVFEIFDKQNTSLGTQTKKVLFDSGNENGIVLSFGHIVEFGLNANNLQTVTVSSPGAPSAIQRACFVTISEINVDKTNILEKPMERKTPLIFSSNPNQTPIIGQTSFMDYSCCINYKHEKFSIDKQ